MVAMIFKSIREDDYIIDKNTAIFTMQFQCLVYEMLRVRRGVHISYKHHFKSFNAFIINKGESIVVI